MIPNGPIPGANFTSDTKNYPWHRPPEFTDLDKAIDMVAKKLFSKDSEGVLTMLETGVDIATITDMFITSGIGAGKWTPDFGLLLAGPVSHVIYLLAKGYDIKCELGIDKKTKAPTSAYFDGIRIEEKKLNSLLAQIPDTVKEVSGQIESGGFMGMGKEPQEEEVM